jgi:hypothetical protein
LRGDKTYEYLGLSVVQTVRDGRRIGHRTLLRLAEVTALRDSGQLERIVAALEAHLHRERVDVNALVAADAPAVGVVATVSSLGRRLGLDGWFAKLGARGGAEALEHAVLAMVTNRLVDPCSKRHLVEWVERDVVMPAGFGRRHRPVLPGTGRGGGRHAGHRAAPVRGAVRPWPTWTCGWSATTAASPPNATRAEARGLLDERAGCPDLGRGMVCVVGEVGCEQFGEFVSLGVVGAWVVPCVAGLQ